MIRSIDDVLQSLKISIRIMLRNFREFTTTQSEPPAIISVGITVRA